MALINQINGDFLRNLAGNTGKVSNASSKAGGFGTFSADSAEIDYNRALNVATSAFSRSVLRTEKAVRVFQGGLSALDELKAIANGMLEVSRLAADDQTADQDRARLNSRFLDYVRDFKKILADTTEKDGDSTIDLLDKGDLEDALVEAGISPSAASQLSLAFRALGGGDDQVGNSRYRQEQITTADNSQKQTAEGKQSPLNSNLLTRSDALVAVNLVEQLRKDIDSDIENVSTVITELRGAQNFAIQGFRAADALLDNLLSLGDANTVAAELVGRIRANSTNALLGAHSDLDRSLAKELLKPDETKVEKK